MVEPERSATGFRTQVRKTSSAIVSRTLRLPWMSRRPDRRPHDLVKRSPQVLMLASQVDSARGRRTRASFSISVVHLEPRESPQGADSDKGMLESSGVFGGKTRGSPQMICPNVGLLESLDICRGMQDRKRLGVASALAEVWPSSPSTPAELGPTTSPRCSRSSPSSWIAGVRSCCRSATCRGPHSFAPLDSWAITWVGG